MVTYAPSQPDPRYEANQRKLATSSIRADLGALRPIFDGLILYGYHEACTPRILAVARDLKFRAVILGIWDPKSAAEVDGVTELVQFYEKDFALAVLVGNEAITFKRYDWEDVKIAAARLQRKLPKAIPVSTSEPFRPETQVLLICTSRIHNFLDTLERLLDNHRLLSTPPI